MCVYIYSFQNFSYYRLLYDAEGFQGGTMVKSPPANAEDASSIPGDLPNAGSEPTSLVSPTLASTSLLLRHLGSPVGTESVFSA